MNKIAVIGSMNVDLVSRVPRFLLPGETLQGLSFQVFPGGKGGNQAVAAARLTDEVLMLGKLGDDANGAMYREVLRDSGIIDSCVETEPHTQTGGTVIEVDASTGDNRIIYFPGANMMVDPAQIERHWEELLRYDIFLLQLEIPMDTVAHAIKRLHEAGKIIILDPAPAQPLPHGLLPLVTYVTPNEVELGLLTGLSAKTEQELILAARRLVQMGAPAVIAKAGKLGAYLVTSDSLEHFSGFTVEAVDTTAAGDSFNAGLAAALGQGIDAQNAISYANAVGAISTLSAGAQQAMPSRRAVEDFIHQHNLKGEEQ